MSEIWIPSETINPYIISDPLDVLMDTQRYIDTVNDPDEQLRQIRLNFQFLSEILENERERYVNATIAARYGLVNLGDRGAFIENVGFAGKIDGLQYVATLGNKAAGFALSIDALTMFRLSSPEDEDVLVRPVTVPIKAIDYIELAA